MKVTEQLMCWAWGAGVDSTAGIIRHVKEGRPIELITFADHGGEKDYFDPQNGEEISTYDFIPVFSDWLESKGYPRPTLCRYQPLEKTASRYREAATRVVAELGLSEELTEQQINRLDGIYGNSVANDTLPGLAFNMKSCSIKHKLQAQEPI